MSAEKIVFITGVSSGFGRALAQEALAAGYRVIGTVRNTEAKHAFEALSSDRAYGRILDITDFSAIDNVIAEAQTSVGPIDVLVNNAGYGHEGVMEESSLDALRHQFEVNVFGAVAMMKAVLPGMRQRRRGHIINITSMGDLLLCRALLTTAAANLRWRGFPTRWAKRCSRLAFLLPPSRPVRFVLNGRAVR